MDKIKIREWVRFKDGIVDKIKDIIKTQGGRKLIAFEKSNSYKSDVGLEKQLKTHSKNKIELIEKGDYVNGHKILNIENGILKDEKIVTLFVGNGITHCDVWKNEDIKDIVTHEQFESVKYDFKEE